MFEYKPGYSLHAESDLRNIQDGREVFVHPGIASTLTPGTSLGKIFASDTITFDDYVLALRGVLRWKYIERDKICVSQGGSCEVFSPKELQQLEREHWTDARRLAYQVYDTRILSKDQRIPGTSWETKRLDVMNVIRVIEVERSYRGYGHRCFFLERSEVPVGLPYSEC